MARKVLPSGQSTFAADQPALQPSQGLKTIGEGVGAVVSVGMDIYKQSQKALTDNQFAEGSLQMDDEWSAVLSKNSNDLDQERVFGNYEKAYNNQIAGIDKMQNLTDNARNALKQRAGANLNSAKQSFRNNLANATAKAATESMARSVEWLIDNRADDDDVYNYFSMQVANGLLTREAANTMYETANNAISYGIMADGISSPLATEKDLNEFAANIIDSKTLSTKQKNILIGKISERKSTFLADDSQLIQQANSEREAGNFEEAAKIISRISDQNKRETQEIKLQNEIVGTEEKVLAAQAKTLSTGNTETKYTKFKSIGEEEPSTYKMTKNEHDEKTRNLLHQLKTQGYVTDMGDSFRTYSGSQAYKYIMFEIGGVSTEALKGKLEDDLLGIAADTGTNAVLFDIDERATYRANGFMWRRPVKNLYPKQIQNAIGNYDASVKNMFESLGIDMSKADANMLREYHNGLDSIQTIYNNDKKYFLSNQDKVVKSALGPLTTLVSNRQVSNALVRKMGVTPTTNTANQVIPTVTTQEEYDALPSGTRAIDSFGNVFVKP